MECLLIYNFEIDARCRKLGQTIAMSNNLRKRGVQDRIRINIHDALELHEWAKKFGVHPSLITDAVNDVGPVVNNVREWLHNRGYIRAS